MPEVKMIIEQREGTCELLTLLLHPSLFSYPNLVFSLYREKMSLETKRLTAAV